jgi:hypothetical protein
LAFLRKSSYFSFQILSIVPKNKKEEVQNLIKSSLERDREIQDGKGPSLVKDILEKTEDNIFIYSKIEIFFLNGFPLLIGIGTSHRGCCLFPVTMNLFT